MGFNLIIVIVHAVAALFLTANCLTGIIAALWLSVTDNKHTVHQHVLDAFRG
jgi:hypothetical protein